MFPALLGAARCALASPYGRDMACRDSVTFSTLSVSNIILTPAFGCTNGASGLDGRFRRFFWIFSGSNQRISISLRQSRVLIPKNDPTTPPWSHKFEEQSLNNAKVGFVVQKLHGPEILKMQNFARRCPLRSRTQKNSALPGAAR